MCFCLCISQLDMFYYCLRAEEEGVSINQEFKNVFWDVRRCKTFYLILSWGGTLKSL